MPNEQKDPHSVLRAAVPDAVDALVKMVRAPIEQVGGLKLEACKLLLQYGLGTPPKWSELAATRKTAPDTTARVLSRFTDDELAAARKADAAFESHRREVEAENGKP